MPGTASDELAQLIRDRLEDSGRTNHLLALVGAETVAKAAEIVVEAFRAGKAKADDSILGAPVSYWKDLSGYLGTRGQKMVKAFGDVIALKERTDASAGPAKVSLRIAAYMVAIQRVLRVHELRGMYA